jgi:hypothetical protein
MVILPKINYILSMAHPVDIPSEDPYGGDTNGNGIGIACYDRETGGDDEIYEIGIAMMAIVSSDTPGRRAVTGPEGVIGFTYQEILQDMADYCAWAQNDAITVDPGIQGIYLYDLVTGEQRHISAGSKVSPDVSGEKIVWEDDVYEGVYVYDLTTNTETLLSPSALHQRIRRNQPSLAIRSSGKMSEMIMMTSTCMIWIPERKRQSALIRRIRGNQPSLAIRSSGKMSEMIIMTSTCMIWIPERKRQSALIRRIRGSQPSLATRLSGWIPGMATGTSTCMIWIPERKCQSVLL